MKRKSRKAIATFAKIQQSPSRMKYLVSYKDAVVELLANAYKSLKGKSGDSASR